MSILLFSAFLIILIILIRYFVSSDKIDGLKLLTIFGIIIGFSALGFKSLFDGNFAASTPVNIRIENRTDENLKIYAIAFWDNNWNGTSVHVSYEKELKPNKKSDFWIENDGNNEFWIVAKNENKGIVYLNVITEKESKFDFKITKNQNIQPEKVAMAKELIYETDENEEMERFAFWINIILTGFLMLSLINIKTGGKTVNN